MHTCLFEYKIVKVKYCNHPSFCLNNTEYNYTNNFETFYTSSVVEKGYCQKHIVMLI